MFVALLWRIWLPIGAGKTEPLGFKREFMGLKPLEPRQDQTRASSQQGLLERANNQSPTVAQPQSQALTQIGPTSAPSSSQVGRVQGATQNLVSPSANEHALANYGKALDR